MSIPGIAGWAAGPPLGSGCVIPGIAGMGCAPGLAGGIAMSGIDLSIAGAGPAGLARGAALRRAIGFFAAVFLVTGFLAAGFFAAGAGIFIPGMFIPGMVWATAGAVSTRAAAVANAAVRRRLMPPLPSAAR
jgi:hypothetical protein